MSLQQMPTGQCQLNLINYLTHPLNVVIFLELVVDDIYLLYLVAAGLTVYCFQY